jgi:hypothetical protein
MRNLLLAVIASLSVVACASPQLLRPGSLRPGVASVPAAQRTATWHRAIEVLLDEGYVPQVLNEAAGYVSAKQRDDIEVGALAGTIAIVTVNPDGMVRVEVGGHGIYHSADELVRDVAAEQAKLLAEIVTARM